MSCFVWLLHSYTEAASFLDRRHSYVPKVMRSFLQQSLNSFLLLQSYRYCILCLSLMQPLDLGMSFWLVSTDRLAIDTCCAMLLCSGEQHNACIRCCNRMGSKRALFLHSVPISCTALMPPSGLVTSPLPQLHGHRMSAH